MRTGISIKASAADRKRLQAIVKDRNAAQKLNRPGFAGGLNS
jgi:hypothetical protein